MKTVFYFLLLIRSFSDAFVLKRLQYFTVSSLLSISFLFLLIFYLIYTQKLKIEKIGKFFFIFILFLFIEVIVAFINFKESVGMFSFREWMRIFSIFSVFLLSYNLLKNESIDKVINILVFSLVFTFPVAFYQILTRKGVGIYGIERIKSTFVHPEQFSYYIVFFMVLTFYKVIFSRNKMLWSFLMFLLFFLLIQTLTLTGIVMFISILILLIFRYKSKLLVFLSFFGMMIIFLISLIHFEPFKRRLDIIMGLTPEKITQAVRSRDISNSIFFRLVNSYELIKKWQEKKLMGYGLATTPFVNPIKSSDGMGFEPHNELVGWLVETGILGVLFYLLFIFKILQRLYYLYKKQQTQQLRIMIYLVLLLFISWQIAGLAGHVFKGTVFQMYLWTLLGSVLSKI